LYPFGYGLSYSKFEYSNLEKPKSFANNESIEVSVTLKNTGKYKVVEVVQLYIRDLSLQ
jgi:beta-glucosidase